MEKKLKKKTILIIIKKAFEIYDIFKNLKIYKTDPNRFKLKTNEDIKGRRVKGLLKIRIIYFKSLYFLQFVCRILCISHLMRDTALSELSNFMPYYSSQKMSLDRRGLKFCRFYW